MNGSPDRPLFSVCMIVKNEEAVLGRALASVEGLGAELLVVDTGSTDGTVAIAEAAGARVVFFPWVDDFSAARNAALSAATGTWLLVLDADEEVTPAFRARVADTLRRERADALSIPVDSLDAQGRCTMRTMSTRFVRNDRGYAYEGRIHETITGDVERKGGRLSWTDLPIVHHGYTASESTRKGRRARNLGLLQAAHADTPNDPRIWHYLGLELELAGEPTRAAALFERVVEEAPEHELASWSASRLVADHVASRRFGAAWDVAARGADGTIGKIGSLVQLGRLAAREGDAPTAIWAADELDAIPSGGLGDFAERPESTIAIRAEALLACGSAADASELLLAACKRHPMSGLLGQLVVRTVEREVGLDRGPVEAVRRSRGAPAVVAGVVEAYVRRRAFRAAADLGTKLGTHNEALAFALARTGEVATARTMLESFGEEAATHLLLHGLARDDAAAQMNALALLPPSFASVAEATRRGATVDREHLSIAISWLDLAVGLREDALADAIEQTLPLASAKRASLRALLEYDSGDLAAALNRAIPHAEEADALEVLGLVSFDRGDASGAAHLLSARARLGDAPVRVVLGAVAALVARSELGAARSVLALGRRSRPHSLALAMAGEGTSPAAIGADRRSPDPACDQAPSGM